MAQTELELQVWLLWTTRSTDELIALDRSDQELRSDRVKLGCEPPSPRHVGSARIPLAHLLHKPSAFTGSDDTLAATNPHVDVGSHSPAGPCTSVTIRGDPSGLSWWRNRRFTAEQRTLGPSYPVFPLYRADAKDLSHTWLVARLEMRGSRTQMRTHSPMRGDIRTEDILTDLEGVEGRLGWNLFDLSGTKPGILDAVTAEVDQGSSTEVDISEQEAAERDTFPAEVVVEQAYHLRVSNSSSQETRQTTQSPSTALGSRDTTDDGFVFVTFAVDGDKSGTLSSPDGLWSRIARSHCHSRQSRVAVTPKMRNADAVSWNYHRFVRLPLWLVQKYNRRTMIFHVWYQRGPSVAPNGSDKVNDLPDREQPELIGLASVDLSSLASLFSPTAPGGYATSGGLDQVYGWYHVIDRSGSERGQVLLGVKPLIPGSREEWTTKPIDRGST
ncbi:unnamed protein product, partial [Echinostoma caproni]